LLIIVTEFKTLTRIMKTIGVLLFFFIFFSAFFVLIFLSSFIPYWIYISIKEKISPTPKVEENEIK